MKNMEADVVVIGGGAAGMPAAVAAAEKGARVILLEKLRAPGGNAVFAGVRPKEASSPLESAESRLQRSLTLERQKDQLFRNQMNYTHWNTNPKLVRALLDKAGDTIRWLGEKGMKFEQNFSIGHDLPGGISSPGVGGAGAAVVKTLTKNCQELGVQILCETRATKLFKNKKGQVTGVLAEGKDGEIRITAKNVVLATGGFAGNKKLLEKYFPNYNDAYVRLGGLPNQGDGLQMATEIGCATHGTVTLEMEGPDFPWVSIHYLPLFIIVKHPETVWVNKKGERYTEENSNAFERAHSIYRQPGRVTYTVFDESIKHSILTGHSSPWLENVSASKVDEEIRKHAEKGRIKVSESWDEIAAWMGAAPGVLKDTIDEYNSFCDKGCDALFLKDPKYLKPLKTPPYYAIRCFLKLLVTHGDIKVNQRMEVLDKEDNPIPGLYAAGVDIGGIDSDTYNAPGLPGHSHGFAVNSGRIAGENAAEHV